MATISPAVAAATVLAPAVVGPTRPSLVHRGTRVKHITGFSAFDGLKATNDVSRLGRPVCADQSFAKIVSSLRSKKGRGGALSVSCNAVGEIFKIAAIMNGLVLVGVAVGFVLLRIEAIVEEE